VEHFKTEKGLSFDYLSPINEPGWKWEYPGVHEEGCRMSQEDILRLLDAAAQAFKVHEADVRILAPEMETIDALERILPSLMTDPRIRELLGGNVSAHSYFTDMFDRTGIISRQRLADTLQENGSPKYWQTEYCLMGTGRGECRDMGMTPALWIAQTIHYDLTILNACSWQWWLSLSPGDFVWKDGLVYSDWKEPGDEENVIPSKMLWALGQYSRFIRRGALRITCRATIPDDLLCSAYWDDSQGNSILVMVNLSSYERIVQIAGLDGAHTYLTDDFSGNDIRQMDMLIVSPDQLRLPARAVMTVVLEKVHEINPTYLP
jgi:O-glycosyl hydrolase